MTTPQDIQRMLDLLAEINRHLDHVETLLNNVLKHGEAAPFIEWAEPYPEDQP